MGAGGHLAPSPAPPPMPGCRELQPVRRLLRLAAVFRTRSPPRSPRLLWSPLSILGRRVGAAAPRHWGVRRSPWPSLRAVSAPHPESCAPPILRSDFCANIQLSQSEPAGGCVQRGYTALMQTINPAAPRPDGNPPRLRRGPPVILLMVGKGRSGCGGIVKSPSPSTYDNCLPEFNRCSSP